MQLIGKFSKRTPVGLAVLTLTLMGCQAFLDSLAQRGEERSNERQFMERDFLASDGYEDLGGTPGYSIHQASKGKKVKFCALAMDFLNPNLKPGPQEREARAAFESSGIRDRYAVKVAWSLVTVPLAERDELKANVKQNNVCFWTDGDVTSINGQYFHVPAVKWDGVVKANQRHKGETPPGATSSAPPAASGGTP